MIETLQKINGKIEMIEELQIKDLHLSLDQQDMLLAIHGQLLDERLSIIKHIKENYIC